MNEVQDILGRFTIIFTLPISVHLLIVLYDNSKTWMFTKLIYKALKTFCIYLRVYTFHALQYSLEAY